jgi:hypothetical protein
MHMLPFLVLSPALPLFNSQFLSFLFYYILIFFNVGALQVGILNPPQ